MNFPKPLFARSTMKSGTFASPSSAKNARSSAALKMLNARRSRCTKLPAYGSWPQDNVAADEIEENAQHGERNQCEQIGVAAVEEWIVRHLPILNSAIDLSNGRYPFRQQFFSRDHDSGDRAAGDVAGGEEHAGALVAFGSQFHLGQILVSEFYAQISIDEQADHSADKDRAGRG